MVNCQSTLYLIMLDTVELLDLVYIFFRYLINCLVITDQYNNIHKTILDNGNWIATVSSSVGGEVIIPAIL